MLLKICLNVNDTLIFLFQPDSTLLIICENGYVLETPFPTIKEEEENRDVVSYEIKDMHIKCFHFSSVKSKILV